MMSRWSAQRILPHISRAARQRRRFTSSPSYSPYEYPTRTSAPIITKTLSSSATSAAVSESQSQKARPSNNFDDAPSTLSPTERSQIIESQKTHLNSSLSPHHKINDGPIVGGLFGPNKSGMITKKGVITPEVMTSSLPNGIRVISLENYSAVSTLGLVCDYGSRYETDLNGGCNQLMELLGFHSTPSFPSASTTVAELGGVCFVSSGREQTLYGIDVLRGNAPQGMDVLAESVLCPNYTEEEVAFGKQLMELNWDEIDGNLKLWEGLMTAGYKGTPLGRDHFVAPQQARLLTPGMLHDFRKEYLTPSRIVLSGTGIPHDTLRSLAETRLSHLSPHNHRVDSDTTPSEYTGGFHVTSSPPNDAALIRVALAFEIPEGWNGPDLVPACVLQTLLGGGNSFSAGGPGKGMYSRLYREILNRYYWVESAEALTHFHSTTGLFSMCLSCPTERGKDGVKVLANHFLKLAEMAGEEEIRRAKNMLKCNVLTQLESRLVTMEDLGRQILTFGKRESQEEMLSKIEAVDGNDLRRVGEQMLQRQVTMSVVGDVKHVTPFHEVQQWFQ